MAEKMYRKYPEIHLETDEVFNHQKAMTEEGLHSKAEIAAELAFRDIVIKGLQSYLKEYGWHKGDCDFHLGHDCSCGYAQAVN